ncbi:MAG: substrate-binding domain-containing protein [Bacteroidetes bacterium]|nr:substrate-binding domain-containing protein [Bacteroidota bacterium]
MKISKLTIIAIVIISVLLVVGYFAYQTLTDKNPKTIKIGFLLPTLENPFFVDMANAAMSMSSEKVKILVQASQDELKQNQIIENFITQGVDAICIVPINSESIIPAIVKANKAKIPVVNIDNKVNMESANIQGAKIAFYIGSDNFEGGQLAAKYIANKLNFKGTVAVLEGVTGNDAAIKRKGGFEDALKAYPNIKIVASQAADWDRQKANDIFQAIIVARPKLNAVFACNDEMALGVIAAMNSNKIPLNSIVVVGFDAIDEAVKAVKEGKLDATIGQQPKLMGKQSIELLLNLLNRETVNKSYSTPLKLIE